MTRTKTIRELGTQPILDVDWRTLLAMPEYAAQLVATGRVVDTRIAALDTAGDEVAEAEVAGVTVTMAGGGSEMWQADVDGVGTEWLPLDETDPLDARTGNRVRVFWQEWIPALGGWGEFPVMTGWPHNPDSEDAGLVSWSLVLRDTLTQAKRSGYSDKPIDVGGFTVDEALAALFEAIAPMLPYQFPASTVVLPDSYTLWSNEPETDWQAIAALAGWEVWTDREGAITAGPVVASRTVTWQEGGQSGATSLRRTLDTMGIYNEVVVISTSSEVVPSITATARDTDPGSPTFVGGKYGVFTKRVESDAVTTEDAALALAQTTLASLLFPTNQVTGKAVPRPDLGYGDAMILDRPSIGIYGDHALGGFVLRMPGGGQAPEAMDVTMLPRRQW